MVFVKSTSEWGEIKVTYPSTVTIMCAVPITVIFCSLIASRWPGSNWRFWSNPFLKVPNARIITGTILVLTYHIPLTSIPTFLFLLSFSVSCVLKVWIIWYGYQYLWYNTCKTTVKNLYVTVKHSRYKT